MDNMKSFWANVKGHAIYKELDKFYAARDASWKNVISIGDSDFERRGMQSASIDYVRSNMHTHELDTTKWTFDMTDSNGHLTKLRVKTLKLLDNPTVEEIIAEGHILSEWLPHIIERDAGYDRELVNADDDEELAQMHSELASESPPSHFKWMVLSGLLTDHGKD